jgi:hypothetical protein
VIASTRDQAQIMQAADALISTGALHPAGRRLSEVQAAAERLNLWGIYLGDGARGAHPVEPWRSLRTRGYDDREDERAGIVAVLPVGAVTPPIGGVRVCVIAVELEVRAFHATVRVARTAPAADPLAAVTPEKGLIWWARDDRGNAYLARASRWWGGGDHEHSRITFDHPLDPQAQRLELIPTAWDARAIIGVGLDDRAVRTP